MSDDVRPCTLGLRCGEHLGQARAKGRLTATDLGRFADTEAATERADDIARRFSDLDG